MHTGASVTHSVAHNKGEYVRDDVHTNSIESFWAVLKTGLQRHAPLHVLQALEAVSGRVYIPIQCWNGQLRMETIAKLIPRMVGKRLTYAELIAK